MANVIDNRSFSDLARPKEKMCNVIIRTIAGQEFTVEANLEDSVADLRRKIASKLGSEETSFTLSLGAKEITSGTLESLNVYDGARIDLSPKIKTGLARSQRQVNLGLDQVLQDISSMIPPEGLTNPLTLSVQHEGHTISFTIHPKDSAPKNAAEEPRDEGAVIASQIAALVAKNEEELSEEDQEKYRELRQKLADKSQQDAREEKVRSRENKRMASKMEELQARMRAKKAHLQKACHSAATMLANGSPAPAPAPIEKKKFAGMQKGFLMKASASSSAPPSASASLAANDTPTPMSVQSESSHQSNAGSFGGLRKGFLLGRK